MNTITLKNFQSHKETTIELHPGLTALIGGSCNGKTAIMRGIRWVLDNRPNGKKFVSYWNRDKKGEPVELTQVTLTLPDIAISRQKGPGLNSYEVGGTSLVTVGMDVPIEVVKATRMDELNVHHQHDSHFMLNLSPGEVAQYINRLVKLDKIDTTLKKAIDEQRETKATIVKEEATITQAQEVLDTTTWAVKANKLLTDIGVVVAEKQALAEELTELKATLHTLITLRDALGTKQALVQKATTALATVEASVKAKEYLKNLKTLVQAITYTQVSLAKRELVDRASLVLDQVKVVEQETTKWYKTYKALQQLIFTIRNTLATVKLSPLVEKALAIFEAVKAINVATLKETKASLRNRIEALRNLEQTIKLKTKEKEELEASLPEVCPLCGGKL